MIATRWLTRPAPASESDETAQPTDATEPVGAQPSTPTVVRSADNPAWLRPSIVFWASTLAITVTAMIRSAFLFAHPIHEQGDDALNSLLANRAEHFDLLIGNYSRVGFHHPGPALLYVLGFGQGLYHDVLHVAPGPYNGELLGAITFTAVLIGLSVLAIYRCTRSVTASLVALIICFAFAAKHPMFADAWFPYLYMGPFLLFVVAGSAVAAGYTVELPSFLLAALVLAHGHVSFLMFVGVTGVAVTGSWLLRYRRDWRAELAAHRRAGYGSLGLIALFLLPVLLQLALHFPGPWGQYWQYIHAKQLPRTSSQVTHFFGWYWSSATLPVAITVVAAVVAALLMIIDRRRFFGFLYAMLGLQSILFLIYVVRGVDLLNTGNRYVGFYYLTVPLLLVVGAAMHLTLWLGQRLDGLARRRDGGAGNAWLRGALAIVAAATAVGVFSAEAVATQHSRDRYHGLIRYDRLVTALGNAPDRHGRAAAFDFAHDRWVQAAGIGIAAQRQHVPWCLSNPRWDNLFTSTYLCKASRPQWPLALVLPDEIPPGAHVIWRDDQIVVIERDANAPLLPPYATPPTHA